MHEGHRQRVRERFLREGLSGFSDRDALELLLFYAIPKGDVVPLAARLLERFGSLCGVLEAETAELTRVPGVGPYTAVLLHLAPALFGRYEQSRLGARPKLANLEASLPYVRALFRGAAEERLYLLCLDASGTLMETILLARGALSEVALTPREVVRQALGARAHAAVLVHNHPGGLAAPSGADVAATRRVIDALTAVDIRALDHLIVTDQAVYSMSRGGICPETAEKEEACTES